MILCHMFCAKVDLAWSRLIQEGGGGGEGALLAQTNLSLFFLQLAFQIVSRLLTDLTSKRKFNLSVNSRGKSLPKGGVIVTSRKPGDCQPPG